MPLKPAIGVAISVPDPPWPGAGILIVTPGVRVKLCTLKELALEVDPV